MANVAVARTAQLLGNASTVSEVKHIASIIGKDKYCSENTYLANLVVHMYVKVGCLEEAAQAFASIRQPNVFSCNIMLAAYARNGHVQAAQHMYNWMAESGVARLKPDVVSGSSLVRAAAQAGNLEQAKSLFDSLPGWDMVTWNVLLSAYGTCGRCTDAVRVLNSMPDRDIVSWTTMLHAFACSGDLAAAQTWFDAMPAHNLVSWNTMLQAAAAADADDQPRSVAAAQRLFEEMPCRDAVACTALISAYGSVGDVTRSRAVFDSIPPPHRDVVAWNAIISAYARMHLRTARLLFDSMPHRDTASHNAMVAAYAAAGQVEEAKSMFDTAPFVNMVSWNSLLQTYAMHAELGEVLDMFHRLPHRDVVSWTILVVAIARTGDMQGCHGVVLRDMPARALVSWNALLAGYVQAGSVGRANALFATLPEADTVSWSLAMGANANANAPEQLHQSCHLLHSMASQGVQPSGCSFLALLTAYSSLGLVRPAKSAFLSMLADFSSPATREHYCAIVMALARAGKAELAEDLLESMPFVPEVSGWGALVASYSR